MASGAPPRRAGARSTIGSVRAALRDATDATHRRMHGLEPFAAIANATLPAERYAALLQSLLLFHSTVGAAAIAHGWADLSSAARRTELLRCDLRDLGRCPRPALIVWPLQSPHAMLGALYAAEGSMLGGRFIAAQLDYLFGTARQGRSFFRGSPGDGSGWTDLLAALEVHCAGAQALDQAIDGARGAFDLFEQCITGSAPGSTDQIAQLASL